jgi:hypothetical protein
MPDDQNKSKTRKPQTGTIRRGEEYENGRQNLSVRKLSSCSMCSLYLKRLHIMSRRVLTQRKKIMEKEMKGTHRAKKMAGCFGSVRFALMTL